MLIKSFLKIIATGIYIRPNIEKTLNMLKKVGSVTEDQAAEVIAAMDKYEEEHKKNTKNKSKPAAKK